MRLLLLALARAEGRPWVSPYSLFEDIVDEAGGGAGEPDEDQHQHGDLGGGVDDPRHEPDSWGEPDDPPPPSWQDTDPQHRRRNGDGSFADAEHTWNQRLVQAYAPDPELDAAEAQEAQGARDQFRTYERDPNLDAARDEQVAEFEHESAMRVEEEYGGTEDQAGTEEESPWTWAHARMEREADETGDRAERERLANRPDPTEEELDEQERSLVNLSRAEALQLTPEERRKKRAEAEEEERKIEARENKRALQRDEDHAQGPAKRRAAKSRELEEQAQRRKEQLRRERAAFEKRREEEAHKRKARLGQLDKEDAARAREAKIEKDAERAREERVTGPGPSDVQKYEEEQVDAHLGQAEDFLVKMAQGDRHGRKAPVEQKDRYAGQPTGCEKSAELAPRAMPGAVLETAAGSVRLDACLSTTGLGGADGRYSVAWRATALDAKGKLPQDVAVKFLRDGPDAGRNPALVGRLASTPQQACALLQSAHARDARAATCYAAHDDGYYVTDLPAGQSVLALLMRAELQPGADEPLPNAAKAMDVWLGMHDFFDRLAAPVQNVSIVIQDADSGKFLLAPTGQLSAVDLEVRGFECCTGTCQRSLAPCPKAAAPAWLPFTAVFMLLRPNGMFNFARTAYEYSGDPVLEEWEDGDPHKVLAARGLTGPLTLGGLLRYLRGGPLSGAVDELVHQVRPEYRGHGQVKQLRAVLGQSLATLTAARR